mgnify:CR=1 FL=1
MSCQDALPAAVSAAAAAMAQGKSDEEVALPPLFSHARRTTIIARLSPSCVKMAASSEAE